jgi:hypothetical protein
MTQTTTRLAFAVATLGLALGAGAAGRATADPAPCMNQISASRTVDVATHEVSWRKVFVHCQDLDWYLAHPDTAPRP